MRSVVYGCACLKPASDCLAVTADQRLRSVVFDPPSILSIVSDSNSTSIGKVTPKTALD